MKRPNVHILILNWNGKDVLYDCVKSIFDSDYINYEVTIIDNGSNDNSIYKVKNDFKDLNFIFIDKNIGYSKGYNYAFNELKNTNDDYYFLLNNDTIIKNNTISKLIDATLIFGHHNIYGPKILNYSDGSIWYAGGKISYFTKIATHIGLNKTDQITEIKSATTNFVSGCAMLIPKKLINSLEGFNECYNFYYEDVDLCIRAKSLNHLCVYVNNSIVIHKISSSMGGRFSFYKLYYRTISTLKYLYNNYNIVLFFIYIIINILLIPFSILNKIIQIYIK